MRWSAFVAILITLSMVYTYHNGYYYTAFYMTFILAIQSAIYSPAKYGYIKECLGEKGLSFGNAYLLSSTLTSILLSSVFFTYLFELHLTGYSYENPSDILKLVGSLAWVLLGFSTLEFICTFGLKSYATTYSKTKLSIAKLLSGSYLMKNICLIKQNPFTHGVFNLGNIGFLEYFLKLISGFSSTRESQSKY